jgi:excisionase family DNA binding protein
MQSDPIVSSSLTTKLLLTVNEAAEALSLGRSAMYALLLSGEVPSIKIGRVRRVPLYGLEAFVHRHVTEERTFSEQV